MGKNNNRFGYLPQAAVPAHDTDRGEESLAPQQAGEAQLPRSVPRGEGRMVQEREQLNVRIPTKLKRQAAARAALEGKTVGELVEELLASYLQQLG